MKLSIIIPVYNVEEYLDRCLSSCFNQNVSKEYYEVVIINDGSTDNSLLICEKYSHNTNCRLFSQSNKGLSAVRNLGIREALGEYIWFVDSDDYISADALSSLFPNLQDNDVISINYTELKDGISSYKDNKLRGTLDGKHVLQFQFFIPATFYVYSKLFLIKNDLFFKEGIYHEDFDFTPKMLYYAKTILSINKSLYYYYIRTNSITSTINSKRSFDLLNISYDLYIFGSSLNDEYRKFYFKYSIMAFNLAIFFYKRYSSDDKKRLREVIHRNKYIKKSFFHSSNSLYWLCGVFAIISIDLYLYLYILYSNKSLK